MGNSLDLLFNTKDTEKILALYKVDGLHALAKKYFASAPDAELALMMEFILHGLASHSLISKKVLDAGIAFKDLMGSMLDMKGDGGDDQDEDDQDF
jgi:magnesium chelatase subunit I